jgi:hypothetical protein
MDGGGTVAAAAASAPEALSEVKVDPSFFGTGIVGEFGKEGSSNGRPPAVKDRQTRQRRNNAV